MDLKELKERLNKIDSSNIRISKHASDRIQDKRRQINYNKIINLIVSQKGLYRLEEQSAKHSNEQKFKLWFNLNYVYDMNIYIVVIIEKEDLNSIKVISAHKVKRKIQEKINKNES